jgi:ectoine hydroxylase-related dioxygenase (phytanoyl-CoA dioxygenase family)
VTISLAEQLKRDGYGIVEHVVSERDVRALLQALAPRLDAMGARGGVRHVLRDVQEVQRLATSPAMRTIAEAAVGPDALPVRGILFDKSPDANWKVTWHQDLTIGVRAKREVEGFGPWSDKDGAPHVQPPVGLLSEMVAVRLHLDDCTSENGPVRVIPGSHAEGRLSAAQIDAWRCRESEVECVVGAGGVLAFRSLLLHASSPALAPLHRRVVHLEYVSAAWQTLPGGLEWQEVL